MPVTSLEYQLFDASACAYPRPPVPVLPVRPQLRWWGTAALAPSVFTGAGRASQLIGFFSRARYALHEAYRRAGLGPAGALLAPSYHCRTLLDPALSLAAPILFYSLDEQLRPDLAGIEALIIRQQVIGPPVRALVLTHYFGMPQPIQPVLQLCRRYGICLIEDCAHAFFGGHEGQPLGSQGDYAVASLCKFFPSPDGGVLVRNGGPAEPMAKLPPAGWLAELRALWQLLEAFADCPGAAGADSTLDVAGLRQRVEHLRCQALPSAVQSCEKQAGVSRFYEIRQESQAGLWLSHALMRYTDVTSLAQRRRANFQAWLATVRDLPHCRPLFSELPEGCVPYMFPLYIDYPEPHFDWLKRLGMPIWRWDEIATSECAVARSYRLHVIQLPCHQSLREAELQWMFAALAAVLQAPRESAS